MERAQARVRRATFARSWPLWAVAATVAWGACGSDSSSGPDATYAAVSGGNQTAAAGAQLAPIVVRVTNGDGAPQPGTPLTASASGGGSVNPTQATTSSSGEASFVWTLGPLPGTQELSIANSGGDVVLRVSATASPPTVASVDVTPDEVSLRIGETHQFSAVVRDVSGTVLSGHPVQWSSSNQAVAAIDGSGRAMAGAPGTATITATSSGQSGNAVLFVSSGPPTQLAMGTNPAGAFSGFPFETQPVVELRDANGTRAQGAAGTIVTAAVQAGSGVLGGTTSIAADGGVARFTDLRIDGLGPHTLLFTSPGLTPVASSGFLVTEATGNPVIVTTTSLAPAVRGVAYTATLAASGGSGTYAWDLVNGSLPVGVTLTPSGVIAGTPQVAGASVFTVRATSGGVAGTRQLSLQVASDAGASRLAITTQPAGGVSGGILSTQPVIAIQDANGNVVGNSSASVTAAIASGPGSLAGTTTVAAANGTAAFADLRIAGAGSHTLTFTSPGLTPATSAPFTLASSGSGGGVVLNVGATTPATVNAGQQISIPVILDFTTAAGANIGAFAFNVTWDASRLDFVSGTADPGSGFSSNVNTNNAGGGLVRVTGFAVTGISSTRTLFNLVLTARPSAANSTVTVAATAVEGYDELAVPVTITPRNLTITITP